MSGPERWFDPTIDEDEARRRPTAPASDAPTPMTAPESDSPVAPANVPQDAVSKEASEPVSRPPSTDTLATQGLPPAQPASVLAEPLVTAANTVKATGIAGGDPQADRVDAEAEAIAAAKYDRAVLSAIATERMMADTETSELIHDIGREFNADVETVRRNLKDYKTRYWEKRALKLSGAQKKLMRENPALASDIFKDRDGLAEIEAGLAGIGALRKHDIPIVQVLKTVGHALAGFDNAPGPYFGDVATDIASKHIAQLRADLGSMDAHDAGQWKPGTEKVSYRMAAYQALEPHQQAALKNATIAELAAGITQNETYKLGRRLAQSSATAIEPEYAGAMAVGGDAGKLALDVLFAPTIALPIMASAGGQTQAAIDAGATERQYLEVNRRSTLLGLVMALPPNRIVGSIPGVKQVIGEVEILTKPNGQRLLRVGGEGIEGGVTNGVETYFQNVITKDVYQPDKDTSDGVLQSIVVGFVVSAGKAGGKEAADAWRESRQTMRPVEVDALRARGAVKLAGDLEATMRKMQHGLRISNDPAALAKYVAAATNDRTLQMSALDFRRLKDDGKLTDDNIRQLGLDGQIDQALRPDGLMTISLHKLLATKIAPEHIGDIAGRVRLYGEAETGQEARAFLKQRDRDLDDLGARLKAANPETGEGAFIFMHASQRLRKDPDLSEGEIHRRAALLAEGFMELARDGKGSGAKYGADFLYYQKISRTDAVDRNLPEDVALQKQLEVFRSLRQGVGSPGVTDGAAKKPSADKPEVAQPPPGQTRRPASPG
jgi:hypothetical protein